MLDMKSPDTLRASIVYNPFDTTDRTDTELVFRSGHSLSSYTEGLPADVEWSVTLNGIVIPKEGMNFTFPKPDDHLIVTPVPEGGGGDGKSVLALVATVVLSVFAPIAGAKLATAMGMGGSALATSLATAAVSIAGGVLINALIPAPEQAKSEETSYGIDGPKNTSTEGVPFPVLYGEHAFGGNFIDLYTENTTDSKGKSIQYLYARTLVSEGPIQSIGQIYINDQPIENYEDVEVDYRLGHRDQSISPWFNETVTLINQNKEMDENWQYYTTSGEVDKIRVDMVAPAGLMYTSKRGNQHSRTVWCDVEYSKTGENDWKPVLSETGWKKVSRNSTDVTTSIRVNVEMYGLIALFTGNCTISAKYRRRGSADAFQDIEAPKSIRSGDAVFLINGLPEDAYEVITSVTRNSDGDAVPHNSRIYHKAFEPIKITAKTSEPVRRTFKSELLEEAVYDVRFKRNKPDDSDRVVDTMILSDVGEITVEPLSLPYVAWLAVKIKMTGQINSIPTITGEGQGRVLNIYDHNGEIVDVRYSRNPADIALDAYMHTRYGGQLEKERIDFAAFAEWRDYCEEKGLTFDAIFYETSNIDDALKHIYIAGRAQRISSGAKLSVAIDRETSPTMMFSDGNIKSGSMEITYLPFADRINDLEIAFNDRNDRFRRRAVRVTNDQALNRGEPLKSSVIELRGVTDQEAALREGTLRMNYNRLVRRTAKWESPLEAVNCAVGDVVVVQHKMPGWGKGGRVLPASSVSELTLDQDVTFAPGKEYRVLVHQNKKTRLTDISVTSQTGNLISIDKPVDPEWNIGRFTTPNGTDFAILRVVDSNTLLLSKKAADVDLSLLTEGSIHEVDYIDDKRVLNPADAAGESVTTAVIELAEDLEAAPEGYPSFIFGDVQFTKKPFRIKSLTRSSDSEVNLTAVEYVEEVYSDDPQAQAHNYSSLTSAEQVRNLRVEERLIERGAAMASYAYAQWEQPENGIYTSAVVQASINGEPYKTVGETTDTQYEFLVEKGDTVLIRVLSVIYGSGATVEPGLATVASLTVRGVTIEPDAPIGWDGSAGVRSVTLFGPAPLIENGFSHFDVYAGDADSLFENATKIGRTESSVFTYTVPAESTHARYWVVEIDTDGNASEPSNHVDITPTAITADEIDEKAITLGKLADAVTQTIDDARAVADQAKADHAELIDGFTKNNLGELEVDYEATQTKAQEAVQAAIDAGGHRDAAETAKTNAEQAQSLAEDAVTDAQTARDASEGFKTASEAAKNAAETAKTQAQTQATNAANSASASAGSASQAETAETNAGNSASAASAAQVAAQTARDDAQTAASASADSASAASASETATGQDAAATASDRTAAQTARSGAETARDAAVTAKNDAEGAASTATTQAGLAAASANDAGDEATAAANSASTAATKATEASQSASTATTQANTATTKAGEAATSASQAASSKSDAEGAASEAASQASNAANSANTAGDEADAAATSASTASTKASEAAQSASTATTQANTATTKAGQASTSASQAATSASTAGTKATEASNSAAAASSSAVEAESSLDLAVNLSQDPYFQRSAAICPFTHDPQVETPPDYGHWGNASLIETVPGTDDAVGGQDILCKGYKALYWKQAHALEAGRKYRVTFRVAVDADPGNTILYLGVYPLNSEFTTSRVTTGTNPNWYIAASGTNPAAGSGFIEYSAEFTRGQMQITYPTTAYVRMLGLINYNSSNVANISRISMAKFEDITDVKAAEDAASAAATSASTASTKATEASQSASTATTQANTATTKAGEAATSASQAATSKNDAAGSASTAATQASNAANSATTAGQQASAAANSASTASTKATEAAQSASSANTSKNTATTKAGEASTSAGQAASSAADAEGFKNEAASFSEVAATSQLRAEIASRQDMGFKDGKSWAKAYSGFPSSSLDAIDSPTVTPSAEAKLSGNVMNSSTGGNVVCWREVVPVDTSRVYRYKARYRVVSLNGDAYAQVLIGFESYDENGDEIRFNPAGNTRSYIGTGNLTPAMGWIEIDELITGELTNTSPISDGTIFRKGTKYVQPYANINRFAPNAVTEIDYVTFEDVTSEYEADQAASAAATSASTASTKATEAAQSASTATTQANTATTKAGQASASAGQAASSASNALTSKNEAASFSELAALSEYHAGNAANLNLYADANLIDPTAWRSHHGHSATVVFDKAIDGGRGHRHDKTVTVATNWWYQRKVVTFQAGRKLRLKMQYRASAGADGMYFTYSKAGTNTYSYVPLSGVNNEQWQEVEATIDSDTMIGNVGSNDITFGFAINHSNGNANAWAEVRFIELRDVTGEENAEASASAAATSASTATTKASQASSSASSASTSANTASTKASQASTSATTAANAANTATGASATAVSARDTAVAVSSQGGGVFRDMFMPYSSGSGWSPWSTGPTVIANEKYPTGNTFKWDVGATDAGALTESFDAHWTGPDFANSFRLEIEFELVSGSIAGAGFLFDFYNAAGQHNREYLTLSHMVDGPIETGRVLRGSGIVSKPSTFTNTANYNRIYMMMNYSSYFGGRAAKHIKVHRFQVYPLTSTEASVQTLESAVVDLEGNAAAALSFRTIAGTAGAELELAAFDDMTGAASLARIAADNVILEGTVQVSHLDAEVLNADNITAGTMSVSRIVVDDILEIDAVNAGFSMSKTSPYDLSTDGIYMGRTNESGALGFGFAMSYDNGSSTESIQATSQTGLKINNAKFFRDLAPTPATTVVTSSQTITLPVGTKTINVFYVGGGGGGHAGDFNNNGANGGNTTVSLRDGSTVVTTFPVGTGGLGGQNHVSGRYGQAGESGTRGTGGAGGLGKRTVDSGGKSGSSISQETPGGHATGYGAGGGGGGGDDHGGEGGKAGTAYGIVQYDVSNLANPNLVVSVGNAGAGASGSANGGNGSQGVVEYSYTAVSAYRADVIPLTPTATGTMLCQGPFPNLGAGFWVLSRNVSGNMDFGDVEINDSGKTVRMHETNSMSFVSSKTPIAGSTPYPNKTINYQFFKMGS